MPGGVENTERKIDVYVDLNISILDQVISRACGCALYYTWQSACATQRR